MKCLNAMLLLCLLAAANMARAGTCTTITPQLSTLSVGTINEIGRASCRERV